MTKSKVQEVYVKFKVMEIFGKMSLTVAYVNGGNFHTTDKYQSIVNFCKATGANSMEGIATLEQMKKWYELDVKSGVIRDIVLTA